MSRTDCDICDEYRAKELSQLKMYRESSEAANRTIETQLKEITALQTKCQDLGRRPREGPRSLEGVAQQRLRF